MTETTTMGGIAFLVALVLYGVGGLISLGGTVWLVVRAFQTSVGWGLAVFFLPFANIVFAVKHWSFAKKPFLLSLAGVAVVIVALVVGVSAGVGHLRASGGADVRKARVQTVERTEAVRESGTVKSDREKVADMLAGVGIDPGNPRTFKGRTIEEMTVALGAPSANMKAGGKILYIFYNCFEVESEDGGKTVSGVHYMGQ